MKKTNALRILDRHKIKYQIAEYQYDPENLDVGHIAKENGFEVKIIYKTLVLSGDKNGVFVALVPGDKTLDFKLTAKASGNKKVKLIAVKDIEKITGYVRGGCSPFGMKKAFPIYADASIEALGLFYVNAGQRGILVGLTPADLKKATRFSYQNLVAGKL